MTLYDITKEYEIIRCPECKSHQRDDWLDGDECRFCGDEIPLSAWE